MFHESPDTALVLEDILALIALVDEVDSHAGIEERQLTQASRENIVVKLDVRERRRSWA